MLGGWFKREGTYVYLWLIHAVVRQKPIQHCKAIILQIKKKRKKSRRQGSKEGWRNLKGYLEEKGEQAMWREAQAAGPAVAGPRMQPVTHPAA